MTTHLSTTNDKTSTCKEPIRRSQRIATARNLNIVHIYVNSLYSEEGSKYRVESSIKIIFQSGEHL